jgi:hypothetical protein
MKTFLFFISLHCATINVATDKDLYNGVSIFQAENILYNVTGSAFIEFKDHLYEITCTEEGYYYNNELFYSVRDLIVYAHKNKCNFQKCIGSDFSDTNCEVCFNKFYN